MSFENYHEKKTGRRAKHRGEAIQLNKHINFSREKKKGNARKDMTNVTCVECGKLFTLPFKPRRPEVYCDECFKRRG